jgi:hypothetical protein
MNHRSLVFPWRCYRWPWPETRIDDIARWGAQRPECRHQQKVQQRPPILHLPLKGITDDSLGSVFCSTIFIERNRNEQLLKFFMSVQRVASSHFHLFSVDRKERTLKLIFAWLITTWSPHLHWSIVACAAPLQLYPHIPHLAHLSHHHH